MSLDININQFSEMLNKKAELDFSNIEISEQFKDILENAGIKYVRETWSEGTSWYRIWSDGWIEQGGTSPRTVDNYIQISFLKAFIQDNPNVQLTRRFYYDDDSTASQNRTTGIWSVTTTGFICYDNGWSTKGGSEGVWRACGY